MNIITRKEAKATGLKRYFTGKPCKRGHVVEQLVSSCECVRCHERRRRVENMTPEQVERQRERQRERNRIENMTPEQVHRKRERDREWKRKRYVALSPYARAKRATVDSIRRRSRRIAQRNEQLDREANRGTI